MSDLALLLYLLLGWPQDGGFWVSLLVGAFAALGIVGYPGFALSAAKAYPFWQGGLIPFVFATLSVTAGAGTLLALQVVLPPWEGWATTEGQAVSPEILSAVMAYGALAAMVLLLVHLSVARSADSSSRFSVAEVLQRGLAPALIGGLVGPILLSAPVWSLLGAAPPGWLHVVAALLAVAGTTHIRHTYLTGAVQRQFYVAGVTFQP